MRERERERVLSLRFSSLRIYKILDRCKEIASLHVSISFIQERRFDLFASTSHFASIRYLRDAKRFDLFASIRYFPDAKRFDVFASTSLLASIRYFRDTCDEFSENT